MLHDKLITDIQIIENIQNFLGTIEPDANDTKVEIEQKIGAANLVIDSILDYFKQS